MHKSFTMDFSVEIQNSIARDRSWTKPSIGSGQAPKSPLNFYLFDNFFP